MASFPKVIEANGKACKRGFTLAELLVAMAILGVIATFTIPKVLSAQQDNKRKAIFRETIATLSEVVYTGVSQGLIVRGSSSWNNTTYEINSINYVRRCNDGIADGCLAGPDNYSGQAVQNAIVLPSGAVIGGMNAASSAQNYEVIMVDWNGPLPPNTDGDDQMSLTICLAAPCNPASQRPGTVIGNNATARTLMAEIFSN